MNHIAFPVPRAFNHLVDLYREHMGPRSAARFALTWLAAARLYALDKVLTIGSLGDLATEAGWAAIKEAGLPADAIDYFASTARRRDAVAVGGRAVAIVAELVSEAGEQPWDVLAALSEHSFNTRTQGESFDITPALADLLLELVGKPASGDSLWLPFDVSGVLAIRALRRGWPVNGVQMLSSPNSLLPLLLAIEFGAVEHERFVTEVERDAAGRPSTTATHVIAVPPFGVKARDIPSVAQWESPKGRFSHQYARMETWTMAELVTRVTKRAVFCVSPGVLFSGGQEHRLREHLVERGKGRNEIETVITTPTKVFANTSVGAAIVVVAPGGNIPSTRMVDFGIVTRNQAETEKVLMEGRAVALGKRPEEAVARSVTLDEIRDKDFLLAPNRYVSEPVEVGAGAVPIGELCQAIRPSALSRDGEGPEVIEIGIPELGEWGALEGPFSKSVKLKGKAKEGMFLRKGDVVLSIKGTIGKVGIVGDLGELDAVVSQSCIVLRLTEGSESKSQRVSPECLLMYLRSDVATAQLKGLQVGAAMSHVAPATLLEAFKVPIPTEAEHAAIQQDYLELCANEAQIADIRAQMEGIQQQRWTVS